MPNPITYQAITQVPIIDVSLLRYETAATEKVANELRKACTEYGFFYISNHGISEQLQNDLETLSHQFFQLDLEVKMQIKMAVGGKAWRGFFPVKGELTSGKPDLKEGIYFGSELAKTDERVQVGLPMHGANLFPTQLPAFRETVLNYIKAITELGHQLMRGLSLSLGLPADYFNTHFTNDPLTLFRIFHYPSSDKKPDDANLWGVGEHTDYGVLTILKQDSVGGLQIKSQGEWLDAPYIPNTFVCNIGDMLERMTGGYYRSTPHRVKNRTTKSRLSFPFFFDPNFDATMHAIPLDHLNLSTIEQTANERWDGANVHDFEGTYGDYVLGKVGKVFPQLRKEVI